MSRNTPSTRDQILDAATSLIRNIGLGHTTTKEIASAAGLSEAALFLCVIGERLPPLVAALKDLPACAGFRSVRTNLEGLARIALPFYDHTLPMATSLFAEPELLARHQQQLRDKQAGPHRSLEQVAAYVRAEQRLGRINPRVDPDAVAALLIG